MLQETSTIAPGGGSAAAEIPDDVANRMSLFYANPTPMLNTLSGATEKLLQEVSHSILADRLSCYMLSFLVQNPSLTLDNTTDCFCTMASVCRVLNENP